jgi:hypothetical protein
MSGFFQVKVYFSDDGGEVPTEFYVTAENSTEAVLRIKSNCKSMGWTDIERVEVKEEVK